MLIRVLKKIYREHLASIKFIRSFCLYISDKLPILTYLYYGNSLQHAGNVSYAQSQQDKYFKKFISLCSDPLEIDNHKLQFKKNVDKIITSNGKSADTVARIIKDIRYASNELKFVEAFFYISTSQVISILDEISTNKESGIKNSSPFIYTMQ